MRVADCQKCEFCHRYTWSQYYVPANYHAIGFSHAYHFCELADCKCTEVRKCPKEESRNGRKSDD